MGAIFHSYGILLLPGVRGHWVMWWSCLSWVPFIGKGRAGGELYKLFTGGRFWVVFCNAGSNGTGHIHRSLYRVQKGRYQGNQSRISVFCARYRRYRRRGRYFLLVPYGIMSGQRVISVVRARCFLRFRNGRDREMKVIALSNVGSAQCSISVTRVRFVVFMFNATNDRGGHVF